MMSIREIPKAYEYSCDRCGTTHLQENAGGHYTNSCPSKWGRIKWYSSSADGYELLFCDGCTEELKDYIGKWARYSK